MSELQIIVIEKIITLKNLCNKCVNLKSENIKRDLFYDAKIINDIAQDTLKLVNTKYEDITDKDAYLSSISELELKMANILIDSEHSIKYNENETSTELKETSRFNDLSDYMHRLDLQNKFIICLFISFFICNTSSSILSLCYKFTSKIVISNIITVLPILVFINTIGIYLLEFYFNKNWENLRFFTLILSFIFFCRAIYNPISDIMIVINKNQVGLILNIYLFFVNAAALFIGYSYHKINYTVIVISVFGGIGYLISLLYLLKKLKQMEKEKL